MNAFSAMRRGLRRGWSRVDAMSTGPCVGWPRPNVILEIGSTIRPAPSSSPKLRRSRPWSAQNRSPRDFCAVPLPRPCGCLSQRVEHVEDVALDRLCPLAPGGRSRCSGDGGIRCRTTRSVGSPRVRDAARTRHLARARSIARREQCVDGRDHAARRFRNRDRWRGCHPARRSPSPDGQGAGTRRPSDPR